MDIGRTLAPLVLPMPSLPSLATAVQRVNSRFAELSMLASRLPPAPPSNSDARSQARRRADVTPALPPVGLLASVGGSPAMNDPTSPAPLVLPLAQASEALRAEVGGKAAGLGAILGAGLPAPDGFVICASACRAALAASGRESELLALVARGTDEALHEAQAVVEKVALPAELRARILEACQALGGTAGPFAVRSSAVAEDGREQSFAGLFITELGVRGEGELLAAISRCMASALAPRVLAYQRRGEGGTTTPATGATPATLPAIAVVVQQLVEADAAGVLFTVDPVRGDDEVTVIEAVPGLGEPLVSGRAAPDRIRVRVTDGVVLEHQVAHKKSALVSDGARVVERALGEDEGRRAVLSDDDARALAELGQALQERLGVPLDVEWARAGGRLVLLQARPITAIRFAPELGEWTTADFRDGGVSADVCTPFLWSLYERAFDVSMLASCVRLKLREPDEDVKWSRMFFGRPYWNLGEVKRTLKKVPGYIEREIDTDLGVEPTYQGPGDSTPISLKNTFTVIAAVQTLFAMLRDFEDRLRLCRAFRDTFPARRAPFDRSREELGALDDAALAAIYDGALALQHETECSYFETIYALTNAKLDFKPAFEEVKRRTGGTLEYTALVGGLTDLSHMRPLVDLFELAARVHGEGRRATDEEVRAYAARWPHHSRRELDITQPRWDEDPELVRELVDEAVRTFDPARDPRALQERRRAEAAAHRAQALAALGFRPLLKRRFEAKLERVRAFAWWREEMRDCSTWMYALVRRIALELGRRLAARGALDGPDEVFFLRAEEAADAFAGRLSVDEVKGRARRGRRVMRGFARFKNPNEVGARHALHQKTATAAAGALRGIPCSSGVAEGAARVATCLDEARGLVGGELLVAAYTDPGWTPLFSRIAGVVTETGGLLSHAAVIAREYGIPAVLAVPEVTSAVKSGELVRIDGSAGTVERRPPTS